MEEILGVLAVFIFWRFLLSLGAAVFLAFVLSEIFASFTALYCIALVLMGMAFGILRHARAEAGIGLLTPVPPTKISRPVAFLGFLLIGFFGGGILSYLLNSQVMGAIALACSVGGAGLWYRFCWHRPVAAGDLVSTIISLLLGFGLFVFLCILE